MAALQTAETTIPVTLMALPSQHHQMQGESGTAQGNPLATSRGTFSGHTDDILTVYGHIFKLSVAMLPKKREILCRSLLVNFPFDRPLHPISGQSHCLEFSYASAPESVTGNATER